MEQDDPNKPLDYTHTVLTSCCVPLISAAVQAGSTESYVVIRGATNKNVSLGDWKITIQKIED